VQDTEHPGQACVDGEEQVVGALLTGGKRVLDFLQLQTDILPGTVVFHFPSQMRFPHTFGHFFLASSLFQIGPALTHFAWAAPACKPASYESIGVRANIQNTMHAKSLTI
jgi:hypothetical protein